MTGDIDTEALRLTTGDGVSLEAELRRPAAGERQAGVVLAHPHPQHGGSMRSLVTSELFRTLPGRGLATLRFNFRGVEGSGGTHGGGRAEGADVVAALDRLTAEVTGVPTVLAGWSFGADVSLSVVDPRIAGWFLIAAPLRILPLEELRAGPDPRPKRFAQPEHDQFRSPASVVEVTAGWPATEVVTVAGADHFLAGRTDRVADLLVELVDRIAPGA